MDGLVARAVLCHNASGQLCGELTRGQADSGARGEEWTDMVVGQFGFAQRAPPPPPPLLSLPTPTFTPSPALSWPLFGRSPLANQQPRVLKVRRYDCVGWCCDSTSTIILNLLVYYASLPVFNFCVSPRFDVHSLQKSFSVWFSDAIFLASSDTIFI